MKGNSESTRGIAAGYIAAVAATLVGCGGGGGESGSGEPPPPVASVVIAPGSIDVTASILDIAATETVGSLRFQNRGNAPIYIGVESSSEMVSDVRFLQTSDSAAEFFVTLVQPGNLRAGIYTSTMRIFVCKDQNCNQQFAGSPQAIAVRYAVTKPTGPNAPALSVDRTSATIADFVAKVGQPLQSRFELAVANYPSSVYFDTTHSRNGIDYVNDSFASNHGIGEVIVALQPPTILGVGTYVDTVNLRSCYDPNCVNEVEGSPIPLTITYRVADSVTDERGNRIRAVQVDAHDMVWDAVSQKIYVSEPAFLGLNADTVRALDPVTGALGPPATLGNHPTALDVSDDGQFLYVGLQNANSIERLNLPNLTRDALIAIPGRSSANNPFLATEIKVAPGEPKTIAIRRADDPFDYFFLDDVAILRDAVQLPNIHSAFPPVPFQNRYVESIAWGADATTLFGAAVTTVWPVIQHLAVDTNGVVLSERSPELPATYGLRSLTHYSSGRVYTDNGFVYDAQSRVIVGGLRDASGPITTRALAVDPAGQVLFGLSSNSTTFHPTYALRKFDVNTRLEIDSIALPFDRHFPRGNRLLRWGHNGLAYHIGRERNSSDKGYILLIDGPFVNP